MTEAIRYPIPAALTEMTPDNHHVLEASAGTGKTFIIEHRVVELVLHSELQIEQILVVTFTEKATAELRSRVRGLIEKILAAREHLCGENDDHWVIDQSARTRLTRALLAFDRASISTIHGYCQRILAENAFANRRLFEQRQVASETAFAVAFKAVLREDLARAPAHAAYLAAWISRNKSVGDLQQLLYDCARQRGPLVPHFDSDGLAAVLTRAAADIPGVVGPSLTDDLERAGIKRAPTRKKIAEQLTLLTKLLDAFGQHADPARFLGDLERVDSKLIGYLASKLDPEAISDPALAQVARCVLDLAGAVVPLAAAVAVRFTPLVSARLERDKARRGEFDFQDMLQLVRDGLAGPSGQELAAALRARHPRALIDEFQDTDQLQWEIFRTIYLSDATDETERAYIDVIGDPKQAIYSFRGADILTYLEARKEIESRGGKLIHLRVNYRSTDAMVRAYNLVFEERFGMRYFSGGINYDAPVRAAGEVTAVDASGSPIPITLLRPIPSGKKLGADETRAVLVQFITAEIKRLLDDPTRRIELTTPRRSGPVGASDIYVLTRSAKESDEVAVALRSAGIRCALYKQEGLFQSEEARQVRDLLAGIAEPRHQSARYRAWQTSFFGVALSDLPNLADVPETNPLLARLYEWKALADRLAYEQLFSSIIDQSGIIERELLLEPSERALTNFLHLFELLLEQVMSSRCELHELIGHLQHWIDDFTNLGSSDRNVQRLESARDAIQIMTIHKAKGLEAGVVFVTGGFSTGPPRDVNTFHDSDGIRKIHVGRMDPATRGLAEDDAAAEEQRLLYVALTRAAARLYLPFVDVSTFTRKELGSYQPVNQRLEPIVSQLESASPPPELAGLFEIRDVGVEHAVGIGAAAPASVIATWKPPPALLQEPALDPVFAQLREQRRGPVVTSYSRMKKQHRAQAGIEPEDFKANNDDRTARLSDDHLPGGSAAGIYLHDVLENLDFSVAAEATSFATWRDHPSTTALFAQAQLRHDQDPIYLPHAQRMVYRSVRAELEVDGVVIPGIATSTRQLSEVEFLYTIPGSTERGFIKGFIDLVFEHDDRVYLVDWKSDVLADYEPATIAAHVESNYALQASVYSLALDRMLAIDNEPTHQARVGGMVYVFLRGTSDTLNAGIHVLRPDYDEVREFEASLAARQEPW